MNTDKFFAEAIANEYSPKDTSKVVALRKLDWKAKRSATLFTYGFGIGRHSGTQTACKLTHDMGN